MERFHVIEQSSKRWRRRVSYFARRWCHTLLDFPLGVNQDARGYQQGKKTQMLCFRDLFSSHNIWRVRFSLAVLHPGCCEQCIMYMSFRQLPPHPPKGTPAHAKGRVGGASWGKDLWICIFIHTCISSLPLVTIVGFSNVHVFRCWICLMYPTFTLCVFVHLLCLSQFFGQIQLRFAIMGPSRVTHCCIPSRLAYH